jgi:hypothetical protein
VTKIERTESLQTEINLEPTKMKLPLVTKETQVSAQSTFELGAPRLFNLEPLSSLEKPLGLRLNLYQMEKP